MTEDQFPEGRKVMNPFWAAGALLAALLISQGYSTYQLLKMRFRLADMQEQAQAAAGKLASAAEEVNKKTPDIRKDQQMAVDLSRVLVEVAREGNKTAQNLVPAMQSDLNQLQLTIKLDGPAPAARPVEDAKAGTSPGSGDK